MPSEFSDRLINGENPIRVWREYRGFKAKELAEKAGISTAYLSEIETGKKEGRVGTLAAIADVLNLTIDDLV
ncbi:MAG: transcriptional regulator [Hyphomicrobiales bacterium]|nr:MAG: transcriptional regulator [Hyphomicrobiales bacterium]